MRILILTTLIYDNPTAQSVVMGLANVYRAAGHTVTAAGRFGPWLGRERPKRQQAAWGDIRRFGGSSPHASERARLAKTDLREMAKDADWIHLHLIGSWDPMLEEIAAAAEASGVRIGATFQDFGNPPILPAEARKLEKFLSRCAWITALSRDSARRVAAVLPKAAKRIRVIGNGWADEPRPPRPARGAAPFVLCASRLLPYKGIDVLLMAWSDVRRAGSKAVLVLCGADYGDRHYQQLAQRLGLRRGVRFLGEVGPRRLRALMRGCSYLVLPSRHEAFGMAVIEAMSCGKPVVATRSGGPQELVSHGVDGILVPPGDPGRLTKEMARLLEDAPLRRKLGARAALASKRFRWPAIAGRYLSLMSRKA